MNCLELRRQLLAAPRELGAEAQEHRRSCAACAAFAEEQQMLEEKLHAELRVPVPEGLADRVLLHIQGGPSRSHETANTAGRLRVGGGARLGAGAGARLDVLAARVAAMISRAPSERASTSRLSLSMLLGRLTRARSPRAAWTLRLVATASLVAGLAIASLYLVALQEDRLTIAVIAHVMHDEPFELAGHTAEDPAALAKVLATSQVHLPSGLRKVSYLGRCGPPNRSGEHIVMQTALGKASLVLMPGRASIFGVSTLNDGMVAVLMPAPVGSLVVVADSKEKAMEIAQLLL